MVRPVQIGDTVSQINDYTEFEGNVWYLLSGIVKNGPNYTCAVRAVNGVMQIACVNSDDDFWCSIGTFDNDNYTITNIIKGTETNGLDDVGIIDAKNTLSCQSYEFINEVPVNVTKFFDV